MSARLCLVVLLLLPIILASVGFALEVDAVALLKYVVDGDTVKVVIVEVCDPRFSRLLGWEGRVRFADINAPELSTPEGILAKAHLQALVKPILYLDIDDLYVFDRYGRVVAVVMVKVNETTLLNLNAAMVHDGYAVYRDYPNEFKPPLPLYQPASILSKCNTEKSSSIVTVTKVLTRIITRTVTHYSTLETTVTRTKVIVSEHVVTVAAPMPTTVRETVTVTRYSSTAVAEKGEAPYAVYIALFVAGIALGYALGRVSKGG